MLAIIVMTPFFIFSIKYIHKSIITLKSVFYVF